MIHFSYMYIDNLAPDLMVLKSRSYSKIATKALPLNEVVSIINQLLEQARAVIYKKYGKGVNIFDEKISVFKEDELSYQPTSHGIGVATYFKMSNAREGGNCENNSNKYMVDKQR